MAKTYVLGDIHGCYEALERVFELSGFNDETDKLIQLGDVCDRGFDTYKCVERLMKIKNIILIEGNHDEWFKLWLSHKHLDYMTWGRNGGSTTIDSYAKLEKKLTIEKEHLEFLSKQTTYYIDEENRCFVHGGFDRNFRIEIQNKTSLCWDRELVGEMMICRNIKNKGKLKTKNNFKEIFIGHTPTICWYEEEEVTESGIILGGKKEITYPLSCGGIWNIDTGSGKGGKLTIMNVDTKEYFQSELTI